jgi:hypothetical protein
MKPSLLFLVPLCLLVMPLYRAECQTKKITDFTRDIAPILQKQCDSCHNGDKAKNGFIVLDRVAFLGFVEPGKADVSSIWTDYLVQPSREKQLDSLVMPPEGPLKASELALIKLWIDEGAEWPANETVRTESGQSLFTFRSLFFLLVAYVPFFRISLDQSANRLPSSAWRWQCSPVWLPPLWVGALPRPRVIRHGTNCFLRTLRMTR